MKKTTTILATLGAVVAFGVVSIERAKAVSDEQFIACLETIPPNLMSKISEGNSDADPDLWNWSLAITIRKNEGDAKMRSIMNGLGC